MGMSSYILDLEEQFDSRVEEAVKQSEVVEEAVAEAGRPVAAAWTSVRILQYQDQLRRQASPAVHQDGTPGP